LSGESVLQGPSLLDAFDRKTGYGVAEIFAEIETNAGVFVSKTVRLISVADGVSPFQQALSSEFNLPYIFFGGSLARSGVSGPEVGLGADCANFIICGLRQCGWQIPWSDAKHLIPRLNLLEKVDLDQSATNPEQLVRVQSDDLNNGIVIIFDNHVAALWHTERPGWLVRCLDEFARRQINLTKIESRPRRERLGSYMFFVDLRGCPEQGQVAEAISGVRELCEQVRVLGSYRAARSPERRES